MKIFLSGEGPTDLGQCNSAAETCDGAEFTPGPMTLLIDDIVEQFLQYSLLDIEGAFQYVGKAELSRRKKQNPQKMSLPGKKRETNTGLFYVNAWMLGEVAKNYSQENQEPTIAILFRDTDGTNSSPHTRWQEKWNSMIQGFKRAEYEYGVPMLPKPKSEAWLLCAAQDNPYQNCAALERLSGNDNSPNSLKRRLDEAMDGHTSAMDVCEWLRDHGFDHEAAARQMTSYREFRSRLLNVLALCRKTKTLQ